jgi:hypothetical protein
MSSTEKKERKSKEKSSASSSSSSTAAAASSSSDKADKSEKKSKKASSASTTKGDDGPGTNVSTTSKAAQVVVKVEREDGVVHAFSNEEKEGIVDHVNEIMAVDDGFVPIDPRSMDIFKRVMDGVLLCKLVNGVEPDTIAPKAITQKTKLNRFEINQNIDAALDGCRRLKLQIVNVGAEDVISGTAFHLVLGVLWQLVRLDLLNQLSRAKHRMRSMLGGDAANIDALVPEQVLILWVNYHLEQAGSARRLANFSGDISDSEIYTVLLHQLDGKTFKTTPLAEPDLLKRADLLLHEAAKQKLNKFINATDIVKGNARLNFAFVASLFSHFQSDAVGEDSTDDDDDDAEEIGGWREDLAELEGELLAKERATAEADARLAELKAQRDAARRAHQAEIDRLTAELESVALAEPATDEERALAEKLADEEREKMTLVSRQTHLLRRAADLADKLDENEDEARALTEARLKAEADIREFKRNHKSDMTSIRRRLAEAKLEEEMLEHELEMQTEERDKLKEERHSLVRKYKDLSVKLEVETVDRIQTQAAKDKLDRELFHAKKYLSEAVADKKVKKKKVQVLTTEVRKLKDKHDTVVREKMAVLSEVEMLKDENKDLTEDIIIEHKQALRSRNVREALEQTVGALKQQLEEDVDFHVAVREQTVKKNEQQTVQLAQAVVRDLGRKTQLLEMSKQEAAELAQQAEQTNAVVAKLSDSNRAMLEQKQELEGTAAVVDAEKAAIEKKRRKLEKQLRKARRLIQDQSKEASEADRAKQAAELKVKQAEEAAAQAKRAAEVAERERRMAEVEVLDTAEAIETAAAEKKALANEAALLANEAEELEIERAKLVLEKERVLAKLAEDARNERARIAEQGADQLAAAAEQREKTAATAVQRALELETERAAKEKIAYEVERKARVAAELHHDAVQKEAIAGAFIEEARELRDEAREKREAARLAKQEKEAAAKEASSLAAALEAAEAERAAAEAARLELERRAALLDDETNKVRLEAAQQRSQESAAREAMLEAAERERRRLVDEERRKAKMAADELIAQGRVQATALRQTAERERAKTSAKTKSLEERLAEAERELEAEMRLHKKAQPADAAATPDE